ncbi:MAG: PPC domain-containing protein, partial [Limisphaerales bacterium]
ITTSVKRLANPALADVVTVKIAISTNAAPGDYELRLGTPNAISNPLKFCVSQLYEYQKPEPAESDDFKNLKAFRENEIRAAAPSEMRVRIPSVINGQLQPGGVDRFRFAATKGQQFVAVVSARSLIPYLADAVPGWFQATLTMYDSKGKEVAYNDDFKLQPDPVIHLEIPHDGEYMVEIKDAIYRGRDDFVYRIALGELPYITAIYPLGGKAGEKSTVHLTGWNLPKTSVVVKPAADATSIPIIVTNGSHISNPMPFAVDTLPDVQRQTTHNTQHITLPIIINGKISKPGGADTFSFDAKAGDEVVAEVSARRLGSPLDSTLKITDASGQQIAFNDDTEDKAAGLNTHHADSYIHTKFPADGTYYVHITDSQQKGGDDFAYRLRISAPLPDFQVRAVPSQIMIRPGLSTPLTIYALRKDGFSNQIEILLRDAPDGVTLRGGTVPANQETVQLTIAAPGYADFSPTNIHLEARAFAHGESLVRDVVPAEDMMQAFFYHHLVPSQNLQIALAARGLPREVKILSGTPLKIPSGGIAHISVGMPVRKFDNRFQFELSSPPDGISIQKIDAGETRTDIIVQSDATKVKTGLQGNLILIAVGSPRANPKSKNKNTNARFTIGSLPAIPFEITSQ